MQSSIVRDTGVYSKRRGNEVRAESYLLAQSAGARGTSFEERDRYESESLT